MKNVTFENQGNNTYLVYEIGKDDEIDNLSLGMINNNKIVGLAPVSFNQIDDKKFLKYNITAKVSASTFLAGTASRNRILGVFSGVAKALLSAEEYMLDANSILLDLDYIYVDVSTCEAELICLPVVAEQTHDVISFFKNIVFSVTYDQTENCDYVAKIIGLLNNPSAFQLQTFQQTVDELNGKRINIQDVQNSQQAATMQNQRPPMGQAPMSQPPMGQAPVGQPPMGQPPMGQAPMGQPGRPGQPPVGQPPMSQAPMGQPGRPGQPPMGQPGMLGRPGQPPMGQPAPQQKPDKKAKKGQEPSAPQQYTVPGAPKMPGQAPMGQPGMPGRPGQPPMGQPAPQQEKKGFLSSLFGKKDKKTQNVGNQAPMGQPGMPGRPGQPPVGQAPMGQPGMPGRPGQPPVGQAPMGQPGIPGRPGQPPVGQAPMGQPGMPGQPPVGQPPMSQAPMGQPNMANKPGQPPVGQPPMNQPPVNPPQPAAPTGISMNFGETTVLGSEIANGETSVLSAPVDTQPYLIRKKTGEKVFISGAFFRIGKESSYVDYFIGDNSAISRSHANIVKTGNDYYIIDTNSKNHTYINGQMIQSNVETPLTHGTAIRLANEEFEFRMY